MDGESTIHNINNSMMQSEFDPKGILDNAKVLMNMEGSEKFMKNRKDLDKENEIFKRIKEMQASHPNQKFTDEDMKAFLKGEIQNMGHIISHGILPNPDESINFSNLDSSIAPS